MSRRINSGKSTSVAGSVALVGCFTIVLQLGLFVAYWGLSGFALKYTLEYWLSQNRGAVVEVNPVLPYAIGGFTGGLSLLAGGVTHIVDTSTTTDIPLVNP